MQFDQIFHAYDVRGTYPDQINEAAVKRISGAYVRFITSKDEPLAGTAARRTIAVGRDVRLSSPKLAASVIQGLREAGVNVVDIGPVPTDGLYFAVGHYHYDGGIQVSASHNPREFNGLKLVRQGVEAISGDSGLKDILKLAESNDQFIDMIEGDLASKDIEEDYLDYLTRFAHFETGRPLKVVANGNFGLTGALAGRLLARLGTDQVQLIELDCQPDGNFPKGRPDPVRPENRQETSELIVATDADFGVAWDADGDRFFAFDELGQPIASCHMVALIAEHLLKEHPGEKIITDVKHRWAVEETVRAAGGEPIINKTGHAFIKNRMRDENALMAGEQSGHYFFRDFYFADNGLIPFLLFLNIVSITQKPVSEILRPWREKYFVAEEANLTVADKEAMLERVQSKYGSGQIDHIDGLSVSFEQWRFSLRPSNTENLLRLNLEAKSAALLQEKQTELTAFIQNDK